MVRSRLELVMGGLTALGLLLYGSYLASLGFNGTIALAIASAVAAVVTGTGIHTITRRKYRDANQNGN